MKYAAETTEDLKRRFKTRNHGMSLTEAGAIVVGQPVMRRADAVKHRRNVGGVRCCNTEVRAVSPVHRALIPTYTVTMQFISSRQPHVTLHQPRLHLAKIACSPESDTSHTDGVVCYSVLA